MKYFLAIDIGASSGRHIVGWCENQETQEKSENQLIRRHESLRVVLTAAALLVLLVRTRPVLSLHAVDVGQGDGILIQADGASIWMDGGSTDKSDVAKYQILPLLPSVRAEEKTEGYREMEEHAVEHGVPVRYLKEGDILEQGRLRMTCLHPEADSSYAEARWAVFYKKTNKVYISRKQMSVDL